MYFKWSKYSPHAVAYNMTSKTRKDPSLDEMDNEELQELQQGFIDLRNHATKNLEAILAIMQKRLDTNLRHKPWTPLPSSVNT